MAPKYKLSYFNLGGRAEVSRWIFAAAGVEYEDNRFEPSEWPAIKANFPNGQVPALFVDGKILVQSHTIARYLARQFGLAGKSPWDEAQADAIGDTVQDLAKPLEAIFRCKDDKQKAELKKKYEEDTYPTMMHNLEKVVSESGFFVGDEMTWADIGFSQFFEWLLFTSGKVEDFSSYPNLKKVNDAVRGHPKIAAWIEKRPKTSF